MAPSVQQSANSGFRKSSNRQSKIAIQVMFLVELRRSDNGLTCAVSAPVPALTDAEVYMNKCGQL